METIGDLLSRDLTKKIEEIVKVYQTDEESVYEEISEYVATDRIKEQYRQILEAMAEAPAEPHEGIGIWISGFFGSGKSSFAKNLGYVLANHEVLGRSASDLFKSQLNNKRIGELVDFINRSIPTEAIMFDVTVDQAVRTTTERIAEIMYRVLLRELGYAQDYDVADLEIELEGEGKLDEFVNLSRKLGYGDWEVVRRGAQKISRASAILHELDKATYESKDSWARSLHGRTADITIARFVERTFELTKRRRPGKALVFIIDEVGQYVARSADKIEDLRGVVEQFGKESKNRLKAKQAIAPVWIAVTSQEKLDEVVAAIDSKRVDIAKLQDRFKYRVDLAPADIRQVATKRVLAKKAEAEPQLRKMFRESQGQLNAACRLEGTQQKTEIEEDDFVQFYPYLPHYIQMSIDIMSGIRLQPGAPRHLGGSNRTIIKQAYEMLVSDRTAMAAAPVGTLVSLDKIFELVEGNLSTEKQKDISDISQLAAENAEDKEMAERVAKVICLLEFVRGVSRTEHNIAACLVDRVGSPAPVAKVETALKKLEDAKFVRNTEEGWKLQTAQEKSWDDKRRSFGPKPKDRNEINREILGNIFDEPSLKTYRYRGLRTFRTGIRVDGALVNDGDVVLSIRTSDDTDSFNNALEEVRTESREPAHKNDIYWVFALTPEIDTLQASLFASRQMVAEYEQVRAQNRITNEEAASLANEKHEVERFKTRLREKMVDALEKGQGLFRGITKDSAALGKGASEIFKGLFDFAFPDLYPKLEIGSRHLNGNEIEEILKAANLNALSQIFYPGDNGLGLVIKQGTHYVPDPSADIAKEILDFIKREHSYGNKVTGKSLEEHFGGIGYGWERDIVRLVLAVLLRAGSIEVTYQGRRFRNYQDPQSRAPFITIPAFKSASFAPRESIGLKTLTTAVQSLEQLTGEEVEIEEGAIASSFKKLADEEMKLLLPLAATVQANRLPGAEAVDEYRQSLAGIQNAASDDCVRILAGEGKSFQENRKTIRQMRERLQYGAVEIMIKARVALNEQWPVLQRHGVGDVFDAETLEHLIETPHFYDSPDAVAQATGEITKLYVALYSELHLRRTTEFRNAIEEIKGRSGWSLVPDEVRESVLTALTQRACESLVFDDGSTRCRTCHSTISEMESDIAALNALKTQVIARIQELTTPPEEEGVRTERVRLAEFFVDPLDSETTIKQAVERLTEHLLKLSAEGVRIIVE